MKTIPEHETIMNNFYRIIIEGISFYYSYSILIGVYKDKNSCYFCDEFITKTTSRHKKILKDKGFTPIKSESEFIRIVYDLIP